MPCWETTIINGKAHMKSNFTQLCILHQKEKPTPVKVFHFSKHSFQLEGLEGRSYAMDVFAKCPHCELIHVFGVALSKEEYGKCAGPDNFLDGKAIQRNALESGKIPMRF